MAISNVNSSVHRKLALIIGNNNYTKSCNKLIHPINNATDLTFSLRTMNFYVTRETDVDASMMEKIENFSQTIDDGDFVLFYYSGHGYQVQRKNYFIHVDDAKIACDIDVKMMGASVERALKRLANKNPSGVTVLILDCYRPYVLEGSQTSNLHEMDPPNMTFIQFACDDSHKTDDDSSETDDDSPETDRNSLYTKHLLKNITKKNVDVREMFQRIADNVYRESNKQQQPLSMNGLHEHPGIYFNEVLIVNKQRRNLQFQNRIAALPYRSPLDLNKQQLIDADMEVVVTKAIIGKQCIWLRLENNKITSTGISTLVTAFEHKNSLEGLGLFGNQLSDSGVQILSVTLSFSKNMIKSLGLGDNSMTDIGMGYLANMLKTNRTVAQLWLQKNQITDQGVQLLIDVMEMHSTNIQELDLSNNTLVSDLSVNAFCSLMQHSQVLKRLWVYGCSLTLKGKEQLLKTKQSKKDFDLRV